MMQAPAGGAKSHAFVVPTAGHTHHPSFTV
jgi:hypothetical protein